MKTNVIHTGDAFEVLEDLDDESVHAVICDPPYGLAFMGRDWDDFEPKEYQEWCENWARRAMRVLKPGGHLLAFSGNRTHHRLFTGVEDAGFEIRDTLTWHYGSGFPKSSDVSKTIDKRADAEREVVGEKTAPDGVPLADRVSHSGEEYDEESSDYDDCKRDVYERAPATDAARKWNGWKTGLKPATEFVVMARKPFNGATVDCVLEHGTGALNIDETRIEGGERPELESHSRDSVNDYGDGINGSEATGTTTEGRYPSNLIFDETAAAQLDQEVGELERTGRESSDSGTGGYGSGYGGSREENDYTDSGGPSRYFYTSKASRSERTENGSIENDHPTVKPLDLMEWLIKMVTREGQVVLDPFAGSGTTCKAAKDLGRRFIGIERQPKYADVSRVRCGLTPENPAAVRDDDAQSGVEDWV